MSAELYDLLSNPKRGEELSQKKQNLRLQDLANLCEACKTVNPSLVSKETDGYHGSVQYIFKDVDMGAVLGKANFTSNVGGNTADPKMVANLSTVLRSLRPMMWWKEPYPGLGPIL